MPTEREVTRCGECPLAMRRNRGPWCKADRLQRLIDTSPTTDQAPDWCPLRQGAITIRLRSKSDESTDVLRKVVREVVSSPWFEWREGMRRVDDLGLIATIRRPRPGGRWSELADHPANVGPLLEMLRAHPRVMSTYLISHSRTEGATHDVAVDLRASASASAGAAGGGGPTGPTGPTEYEGATDVQALCAALLALPGKP